MKFHVKSCWTTRWAAVKLQTFLCTFASLTTTAKSLAPQPLQSPPPARSLKLMTYNIHAWRDSNHVCNFDRIVEAVNLVKPDILCLNEVLYPFARPDTTSNLQNEVENYYQQVQNSQGRDNPIDSIFTPLDKKQNFLYKLADATHLNNVHFVGATDNSFFGKGVYFGNAILTRYTLLDCREVLLLPEPGDVDLGNQKRDFVDPRAMGGAKLKIDSDDNHNSNNNQDDDDQNEYCTIGVVFAHLDHKSEELREQQSKRGIHKLQPFLQDIPHFICGDFNTFSKSDCDASGWQDILDLYKSRGWPAPPERSLVIDALQMELGYHDTFYECPENKQDQQKLPDPTSWTNKPLMRIDHVFVNNPSPVIMNDVYTNDQERRNHWSRIVPIRHYRIQTDASDHFPVVVEFDIDMVHSLNNAPPIAQ